MRVAALIPGLIAGVLALASPFVFKSNLMAPYLEHWAGTVDTRTAVLAWYALPVAAVLGGLLAVVLPGFAALLLGAAAFGWAAIAVSTPPELLHPGLLGPAGIAALAAVIAQLAGELVIRRKRQRRREWRAEADADDGEIEREAALRLDPTLMPRDSAPPPPRRAIPLTLEDVTVTERPAPAPPPPRMEEPPPAPQPPPRETANWEEAFRPEPRVARRSVGFQWDEHDDPAVDLERGRPRQGPRLEPRNPPGRTEPAERVEFVARPTPQPASPPPPPRREVRPEPEADRWIEPEIREPRYAPEPGRSRPRGRRGSFLVPALAGVGAVLLVALLLGGGYFAYREGYLDPIIGAARPQATEPATTVAADVAPEAPAQLASTPPATAPAPAPVVTPQSSPSAVTTATAPPSPVPATVPTPTLPVVLPQASAATGAATASTAEATYDDPFAYCAAVGTIDYPDGRYRGPAVVAAMAQVLRAPLDAGPDRVRWRCVDGRVLACASYAGPICDTTPSVAEMRGYCERNPNAKPLFAPHGIWSCVEGKPQLPPDANWLVDDRGYMPRAWVAVRPPDAPNG